MVVSMWLSRSWYLFYLEKDKIKINITQFLYENDWYENEMTDRSSEEKNRLISTMNAIINLWFICILISF